MRRSPPALLLASALAVACSSDPPRRTLAELHRVDADVAEVPVGDSLDQAMQGYRSFLEEAPESELTPEAMRRLADLKLEKEYGLLGDGEIRELPAPEPAKAPAAAGPSTLVAAGIARRSESDAEFERRASLEEVISEPGEFAELPGDEGGAEASGPLEAIALYDRILATYPDYEHADQVLYQKARAYDELGRVDEAVAVIEQLVAEHPGSRHVDEVQFRRAEYFFVRRRWIDAEKAYSAITAMGARSEYYELALYKLGWTFYKQDLLDEALDEYVRLLDYKVSTGYDFEQSHDEDTERRIADTFRVISLSFSNLGGAESAAAYFDAHGARAYEDRIYSHLGEFYFEKLRYDDAARAYQAFVARHPLHRSSPRFAMRVIEIYEAGGFPKLVLEAKKQFAATYALDAEYWRHVDVASQPEVRDYLKANLSDLASHYHALFQNQALGAERPANYAEALRWYRAYLGSFASEPDSADVNHRLADLLLEHRDFGDAAREYERTAYEYPQHERSAAAGYAAIYAHREGQKAAAGAEQEAAKRAAVASTLRFVDAFPQHEQAAAVLGAAVSDLYEMKEFTQAIATGRRLLDAYPAADAPIRRAAWTAVAHSSFELGAYGDAEVAYQRVLETTPPDDSSRAALSDNLAAAIYKQGEQATAAGDSRAAADHFLRIAQAAPTSSIRPAAEYDAAAALIRLQDWAGAASVLEAFRAAHPEHELAREATRQLAIVYREQQDLSQAAAEYERVAAEATEPELRREALLEAGALFESAQQTDRARGAYLAYVDQFPEPIEAAVETRFKLAGMYETAHDEASRLDQLRKIVEIDAAAGAARTPRTRQLAARAALVLSEGLYRSFLEVALVQPFEARLREKQRRMDAALAAFTALVEYEDAEVTTAATFYMAETYYELSRALLASERPAGLDPRELAEYESALEEEAFPIEEKAIHVHEKNVELMATGIYNPWIQKSLEKLAERVPGRYAKSEASSGALGSLESYAYQAPRARAEAASVPDVAAAAPDADGGEVAPPASAPGELELSAPGDFEEAPPAAMPEAGAFVEGEGSDAVPQ